MGIFRQFPYSNFHDMNMDTVLRIMREMQDEWAATKTEWASYKDFIDNYFANLDLSQEVLNNLRAMIASGEMDPVIDPVIVAAVAAWLAENIEPTTPIVDASLTIEGAAADAKATGAIKDQVIGFNSFNILFDKLKNDKVHNGVTYSWTGNKCLISGTASATSFDNIASYTTGLPAEIAALKGIPLDCYYPGVNSRLNIICHDASNNTILNVRIVGWQKITIPVDAVDFTARLYVQTGVTLYEEVEDIYIVSPGSRIVDGALQPLKFGGLYGSGESADDAELNTTFICDSSNTDIPVSGTGFLTTRGQRLANPSVTMKYQTFRMAYTGLEYYRIKPSSSDPWSSWRVQPFNRFIGGLESGADLDTVDINTVSVAPADAVNAPKAVAAYVYTFGNYSSSHVQIWMAFGSGLMYYRHGLNGVYSGWISIGSGASGNPNASMFSVCNSIITGSVWLNGSYDHLCEYNNSPYGIIATAMNIPQANVDHVLHSSTGLLYDAGEDNFLTTIMSKNLANIDVVLTHMWLADMNHYPVGALTDQAGTDTLVAAVKTLINYIKTQNKNTQLILVSVPPSSTTISGANVFTGEYPNGSSISDLDTIMKQLAEELHFTYIDFQELNMSYWYQDLTDGSNVHLNNENSYRIMGSYLAGRASAKLTF